MAELHKPSLALIEKLHPAIREHARAAFIEANEALTGRAQLIITSTLRSFDEQQHIYDQGRTTPGQKVTNAKPGQSIHNYSLALDGALLIDGKKLDWDFKKDWDGDRQSDWSEVVVIFKKHGFKWGGDWISFKDLPHFEMTFGKEWRDLLALHNANKMDANGFVNLA